MIGKTVYSSKFLKNNLIDLVLNSPLKNLNSKYQISNVFNKFCWGSNWESSTTHRQRVVYILSRYNSLMWLDFNYFSRTFVCFCLCWIYWLINTKCIKTHFVQTNLLFMCSCLLDYVLKRLEVRKLVILFPNCKSKSCESSKKKLKILLKQRTVQQSKHIQLTNSQQEIN